VAVTAPAGPGEPGSADGRGRQVRLGIPGVLYRVVRFLVHAVNRVYWRVSVVGPAVPDDGPVILAPVHRSFLDFFVVSEATRRKVFYMTKDDLWRSPRLGRVIEALGGFPVNREGPDRLALDRAQAVLERGDVLILFPEGTRRAGPVVEDLHEGAAFLAARTGAVVVPIGIGGSDRAMPKGSKMVRPVTVHLAVGDAMSPPPRSAQGRVPRTKVHAFTVQLAAEIQRLYDQARRAAGDHVPDRPPPPAEAGATPKSAPTPPSGPGA
jgi:1-acyl-sn-glycerol-3-phosphate acyltransferase